MSRVLVKIILHGNVLMAKKLNITDQLSNIRASISNIPDDAYFLYEGDKIPKIDENDITIEDILQDKKIFMEFENNWSSKSEIKSSFQPIIGSKLIERIGNIDIYLYPNTKFNPEEDANSKSIILLGQTGTGKTTLINRLINYLTGIKFEDKFRYKIIEEEPNRNRSESQTSEVNIYYIHSHNGYPQIKIIDTPGFGDARGIEMDMKIIKKIENVFKNEINQINTICFVTQSCIARLTAYQKYIHSNIINIFGNDVAENFIVMLTFCDLAEPPIVNALEDENSIFDKIIPKIKLPWYYKFNNCDSISTDKENIFTKMFWELGMESFKNFIKRIESLPAKSLNLTKEVLSSRNNIITLVENIQIQILKVRNFISKIKLIKEKNIRSQNDIKDIINEGKEILSTYILIQQKIKNSFNHLKLIELNPKYNLAEYIENIELLIEDENNRKLTGWKKRVEGLENCRNQQKLINQAINGENDREFEIFKNELNDLIERQEKINK